MLQNVAVWRLWISAGFWKNPHWDLFNDYAKYIALGAGESDVDLLIEELDGMDLPIPGVVDKTHWRGYTDYLEGQPVFDYTGIDAVVRDQVLMSYRYPRSIRSGQPTNWRTIKNYYSDAFVDKGAPGRKFVK